MWLAGLLITAVGFYAVWYVRQRESAEDEHKLTDGKALGYLIVTLGFALFLHGTIL